MKRFLLRALLSLLAIPSAAQVSPGVLSPPSPADQKLTVTVTDEHGLALRSARVLLQPPAPMLALHCETDFAGLCEFDSLPIGSYQLNVDKAGFYSISQADLQPGLTPNVDVTLSHQQAAHEVINVAESAPVIDPAQISSKEELTGSQLTDIPYPGWTDYRNALFFIPGVTPDGFGQAHVAGAETWQTLLLLDGFNVTQPTNGQLVAQTSVDSFRSIQVTPSREPAEFGKGSGGVLALNTRMGNDHLSLHATNFFPSIDTTKGVSLGEWTPLYTLSGPIRRGKMWFIDALDGEYDDDVIKQLPAGFDRDHVWRIDNLAKLQSDLTSRNIVTASFLYNFYRDPNDGLSLLQPQPSTDTDLETAYLGSIKDQYYLRNGALLETGFGVAQYSVSLTPHGTSPYILLAPGPSGSQGAIGNYYETQTTLARRVQAISDLNLPPQPWHGRHDLKVGVDIDLINYDAQFLRQPISFLQPGQPPPNQTAQPCPVDADGIPIAPSPTCARYSLFTPGNYSTIYNTEASAYVEDRWLITNRLLIEPGLRFDEDQIIRTPLLSPRLAGAYSFDDEANTKISAGIGIVYDNTTLGLIHQPLEGQRVDYFFNSAGNPTDANGNPVSAPLPVPTNFVVNRNALLAPRYLNWSIGFEKKLPAAVFLKLEFLEKRGTHGFAYNTLNGAVDGAFLLGNRRDDRYYALQISARHRFHGRYEIFAAYTHSRSTTNQVFDFSLDFPLLSAQLPGPYPWDTPNRIIGWGVIPFFNLPILHKLDLVYSGEARTGIPIIATTDQLEIPPGDPPGTFRLPTYYTLNLQFEKRFHLFGRYWALRGGFDNITNHANPYLANGTLDAAHPSPTFIDANGRDLDSRIMYLGKQ